MFRRTVAARLQKRISPQLLWRGCFNILALSTLTLALGIGLSPNLSHAAVPDFSQVSDSAQDAFLPVEQAFVFKVQSIANEAALKLTWQIAPNYSLYRDRIRVSAVNAQQQNLLAPLQLDGQVQWKQDPNFGRMAVYHQQLSAVIGLAQLPKTAQGSIKVNFRYQGCADSGLCFPPVEQTLDIPVKAGLHSFQIQPALAKPYVQTIAVTTAQANGAAQLAAPSTVQLSTQHLTPSSVGLNSQQPLDRNDASSLARFLSQASLPLVLLTLLLLGAGLAFTPCVFPMMPILSGLIAGEQRERLTGKRGFQLSAAYVLGMASCYAFMGTLMGYFGAKANLQLWLQKPVVLIVFAGLFVLLALGMFGLFTLQLPSRIRAKLDQWSHHQRGGRLGSVALMGALSALVVSPCVSAPLAGVLIYISATGDAAFGAMALFSLGLGMGIPLMILGTTSAKLLPRAGTWMDQVKSIFGVGLLAVAIWLLSRVWTGSSALWLWGALLGGYGVWLGAFEAAVSGSQRLVKALALGLFVLAVLLWIGAATGQDDPLRPLGALSHTAVAPDATKPVNVEFNRVQDPQALQALLDAAKQKHQTVVIDVSADWCAACQVMERTTFRDSRVIEAMQPYTRIRFDLSDSSTAQRQWLQAMHLYGPPALIFLDGNGQEIQSQRVQGEMDADHLLARMTASH